MIIALQAVDQVMQRLEAGGRGHVAQVEQLHATAAGTRLRVLEDHRGTKILQLHGGAHEAQMRLLHLSARDDPTEAAARKRDEVSKVLAHASP